MTKQEISLEENFTTWCKVNNVSIISKAILLGIIEKHSALQQKQSLAVLRENIGALRQWLNEDHITDPNKMVTNEHLEVWFDLLQDKEGEERG